MKLSRASSASKRKRTIAIDFWKGRTWHQPGLFFPRSVYLRTNGLDKTLNYSFDFDLLCKLLRLTGVTYADKILARFRIHKGSKTSKHKEIGFLIENSLVSQRYWRYLPLNEIQTCREELSRRLVRRCVKLSLTGKFGKSSQLLKLAWDISQ